MTQPKDPQKPKILGYLHWQIGNDWATYHAIKPGAEFGITSNIEPLVSIYDFQALQSKLEKAEAEAKAQLEINKALLRRIDLLESQALKSEEKK